MPLEQLLRRNLDARFFRARDDLQTEDRIAAGFEEVAIAPQRRRIDRQHFAPDTREPLFHLPARRVLLVHMRHGRFMQRLETCKERSAIELAVRIERQRLIDDDIARHHVIRQYARCLLEQRVRIDIAGDARTQPLRTIHVVREHRRRAHVRETLQHALHFARLDAISANLDLIVGTSEVFERAIRCNARQIARSIHTLARHERVRHEALGAASGLSVIAARHARATQIKLACRAGGHGVHVLVEHVDACVGERCAQRQAALHVVIVRHRVHCDADRRFRRSVMIEDAACRRERGDLREQRRRGRFAADDQRARGQHAARIGGAQQRRQMTRHDLQYIDAMLRHVLPEGIRIERPVGGNQMQRARRAQRAEQGGVTEIGGGRRDHRERRVLAHADRLEHAAHVVAERGMAHRHALGLARRSGRVDQIRGLSAMKRARRLGCVRFDVE
ncbi:hypothetical protein AWB80_08230 [Caballeronia pedi]|uniref:Uncharacterized protein n=1 Tax=Caballeronia pedi TaxID=1777141 RepID=A0A158E4X3_9BURK|nr:hypothetical protein AWB80_08230 [Caballeronia pedi]